MRLTALSPLSADNPTPSRNKKKKMYPCRANAGTERRRLILIRALTLQLFGSPTAAVIDEDRRKRSAARRPPDQRVQLRRCHCGR